MKRRIQFRIRTLLMVMLILGPVSGWYGPTAINKIREQFASDSSPNQPAVLTNSQKRQLRMQQLQAQLLKSQQQRDALSAWRASQVRPRYIKSDGTFNMRYHLAD